MKKYLTELPNLLKEWHPTKDINEKVRLITTGSAKIIWWKCENGPDHEWKARVSHRSKGIGCPFCTNQKVSVTNSLSTTYPEIAKEWHPTKNGDLTPSEIVGGGKKSPWWKCENGPDHEWKASLDSKINFELKSRT